MFMIGVSFWVSVSTLLLPLFRFIARMLSRVQVRDRACLSLLPQEKSSISSEVTKLNVTEGSVSDEENSPKFFSKFQFRRYEEFIENNHGDDESVIGSGSCSGTDPTSSTNKYQFMSGKALGVFMEEPEALSFSVKELYVEIDKVLEKPNLEAEAVVDSGGDGFLSDGDFEKTEVEDHKDNMGQLRKHEQFQSEMLSEDDFDDESRGFESLWEHQELIEQLRMELKKVRATGLATIEEGSECPRMMEDLKPWKIEDKLLEEKDTMGEVERLYKSYRERMRKFDILNYQKMYATGCLQSTDSLESISNPSIPVIRSLLYESFRMSRHKKSKSDPMIKFMRELHSDLEMVYVGQMCLSWEFLHWQYEKTLELWESDPHGILRYNEVAGEFQQFQVLMQRFIENEPFQGPRVQNYAKNRCVLRNLLQVPVIREDNVKDKRRARNEKGNDAITSDMLVEFMEESIRIFWRFLRADKHTTINNGAQIARTEDQALVQDLADKKLFMELRADLQKKEKKLKEVLRSGRCILKRFQNQKEESSEQMLHFFSQVDMKLVARVLNMSRVASDQLVWCHNKLSKISFIDRKISVEPSFLLFPC